MGKAITDIKPCRKTNSTSNINPSAQVDCESPSAPLCLCCQPSSTTSNASRFACEATKLVDNNAERTLDGGEPVVKELIIVGAGPHALALALRLLEPEADFLSDKERHMCSDYSNRMRPISDVRGHIKDLVRGPKAVLKQSKGSNKAAYGLALKKSDPPPLRLDFLHEQCTVIDSKGSRGWMASWRENFENLEIPHLRSSTAAHCDPYDPRSLQVYAELQRRQQELVGLDCMSRKNGQWDFHGPFNAPSTSLFHDFHDLLAKGYGISEMIDEGIVTDIQIVQPSSRVGYHDYAGGKDDPTFVLTVSDTKGGTIVLRTRRLACALGPATAYDTDALLQWETPLREHMTACSTAKGKIEYTDYVLRTHEISAWLANLKNPVKGGKHDDGSSVSTYDETRILIVGGGITSGHLALFAAQLPWCSSVTLIQRSTMKEKQFDIDPEWIGPRRGKLLQEFQSLAPVERLRKIQEARGGGSISPEVIRLLRQKESETKGRLVIKEGIQIECVEMTAEKTLKVTLDDETTWEGDMIWLATGFANHLQNHPILGKLERLLPIPTINGLPILNPDLSWGIEQAHNGSSGIGWKAIARKRCWVMGAMAGLELGPDALNLMGARQGAVRVAKAIRMDLKINKK